LIKFLDKIGLNEPILSWRKGKIMRYLMIVLAIALMIGCATGEQVRMSMKPGMEKAELIKVLGNPDGFKNENGKETLVYLNRLISGWSWDRTDYIFVFQNDKLIQAENGDVRQNKVGGMHTIFVYPVTN
jgi:hypothetical protein